jgi:hypothetical protein
MRTDPCPRCGHAGTEHRQESWYDEEGVEAMICSICEKDGIQCRWTWDWNEVTGGNALGFYAVE